MKLKWLFMAAALPAMALVSSCGDGEDDLPKPTISLTDDGSSITGNAEVIGGKEISFNISATAGSESLNSFMIVAEWGDNMETVLDTSISGKTFSYVAMFDAYGSPGDDVKYKFTAKDGNGESTTKTVTLAVVPEQVSLDGIANQKVFNVNSQGQHIAFDLTKATPMLDGTAPAEQDIKDGTASGAQQWGKTWTSGNGTTFVKVTLNDYNNASDTKYLFNLYKANKDQMTTEIAFEEGEVILARSAQDVEFNLFIIKIDKVVDLPAIGNNNDYVQFGFKGVLAI